VAEFYFLRYILAFACALCQTLMWRAICLALNARVGLLFIFALVFSPGNFHASTAFLPSSFAMYMAMVGAACFLNWRGGIKTSQAMAWFAVGGVLGWPFAAALCAPFVAEELFFAVVSDNERRFECFIRIFRGIAAAILFAVCIFPLNALSFHRWLTTSQAIDSAINTFFYRNFEIVTWNIIKYNIFSKTGGPNLYGTEPWAFYFKNLLLNFNIWFILALLSLPIFLLQKLCSRRNPGETFQSGLRTVVFLTPFYMWLAIFTLQPHKEERFMYPAYPFLALNAALAMHTLLAAFGNADPASLIGRIPSRLKLVAVAAVLLAAMDFGLARIWGLYSAYHAPMALYAPLKQIGGLEDTVCFGKDWYRFPSSFFLPKDMHAKWVRSEFRGLLPGEFSEARTGFGFWSGTWLPTSGLNDRNEEDPGKYVDLKSCVFLVDTRYPERGEQQLPPNEPDYAKDVDRWEVVHCLPFLDAERTHFLARAMWLPEPFVPDWLKRRWGEHCLLKQRR
jgi:alpha-1,2-mannosyltransferase